MATDVFSNFGALDELIQVIYQGIYRFVALSSVTDDKWTMHLGQAGSDGRWWRGNWTETDVHNVLGSKASESILEQFSEKVAELLVGGELFIGGVNPSPSKNLTFTIGPAAKKPVHMELVEIPPSEAAEFATTIFLDIALQAQSRKGRLHGSSMPALPSFGSSNTPSAARSKLADLSPPRSKAEETSAQTILGKTPTTTASSSRASSSKAVEKEEPKAKIPDPKKRAAPQKTPTTIPQKGVALGNPTKKARRYQKIEFESDDDDD
ncbi:hypothetical protein CC1G_03291 [Coprinopsis cinerea okayama7|uniref:Uncharacterized protein n=1 Tax=Coprinopsis cinerea (strain Okayama-7 / 130 / ATCC MYA-4618 / FGSC 9003) TaxID=240176 RepID=A8N7E8_COPC7|nr:hypothetical protein CC1G_03291 [Coprinopsis cinerea okayama7\|eukprot:XP_001830754.2 hypothetical protein CC1G_03291 [Coprinopsis cinerea okayama7\